jgi:hypothetical protein
MTQCFFCGQKVQLIHVHGHYQCPICKTNAMPCCDGDNCDTNVLLKQKDKNEDSCSSFQSQISNIRSEN